jgi:hypothetical protein
MILGQSAPTSFLPNHTAINICNPYPPLHLLRLLGYSTSEETMMPRSEPNQALRTSVTTLFTGIIVLGLVLIIGVGVTGPA